MALVNIKVKGRVDIHSDDIEVESYNIERVSQLHYKGRATLPANETFRSKDYNFEAILDGNKTGRKAKVIVLPIRYWTIGPIMRDPCMTIGPKTENHPMPLRISDIGPIDKSNQDLLMGNFDDDQNGRFLVGRTPMRMTDVTGEGDENWMLSDIGMFGLRTQRRINGDA
jgi:hypothetical protein